MIERVIVTGGAGFIGSAMVRYLIKETSSRVLNLDRLTYAANLASLAEIERNADYTFCKGDINDRVLVRRVFAEFQPDLILHLAAESHVDRSIEDPSEFVITNVLGTSSLLHEALHYWQNLTPDKRTKFRFCHVSTDEVFGALGTSGRFVETSRYDPNSPYAASKAGSDHLARAWHRTYSLPVVISNCCNNYGPYQFPEKLIPLIILKALHGEQIPIYGDGQNVRDWLYVNDHVRALWTISNCGQIGETYLVGGNTEKRNIDVARAITRILDEVLPTDHGPREKLISFVPDRPGHDYRYATCSDKIIRGLGWQPSEDFESGLRKTVQWYLDNQRWWEPIWAGRYQGGRLGQLNTSATSRDVRLEKI